MKYRIVPATVRGKKMWVIDVPATITEKRKRIFHQTKREADQEARDLYGEVEDFPLELRNFTRRERSFLRHWLDRMPIEQMEAVMMAAATRKETEVTVSKAVEEYLNAPRERKLSDRHLQDLESRLGMFKKQFGETKLTDLDRGKLEDYIRSKEGSAPNHYRILRGLFFFAVRRDWIDTNPVKLLRAPVVIPEDKDTFSPEQMCAALRISAGQDTGHERYEPILRMLIAGGFCGLRHSEVMRMDCSQIDTERGEIHVTKMKTAAKGLRERYVVVPENSKAWLKWLNLPSSGPYIATTERNLRRHRDELVAAMKLEDWPHNVLRRSFGSYHLAAYQNAALTAELMGHTDAETTKSKYRVPRRKEIAEAWFALTPEAVL